MISSLYLLKAASHKYFRRIPLGRNPKTGTMRYRYIYKEHHAGGLSRGIDNAKEGEAFKLADPQTGQKGHFHVQKVSGDKITIKHDESGREVTISKAEFKALMRREHGAALKANAKKKRETYERMKRDRPKSISLSAAKRRAEAAEKDAGIKQKTDPSKTKKTPTKNLRQNLAKEIESLKARKRPYIEEGMLHSVLDSLKQNEVPHPQAINMSLAGIDEYARTRDLTKEESTKLAEIKRSLDSLKSQYVEQPIEEQQRVLADLLFRGGAIDSSLKARLIKHLDKSERSLVTQTEDLIERFKDESDHRQGNTSVMRSIKSDVLQYLNKELDEEYSKIQRTVELEGQLFFVKNGRRYSGKHNENVKLNASDTGKSTGISEKIANIKAFMDSYRDTYIKETGSRPQDVSWEYNKQSLGQNGYSRHPKTAMLRLKDKKRPDESFFNSTRIELGISTNTTGHRDVRGGKEINRFLQALVR